MQKSETKKPPLLVSLFCKVDYSQRPPQASCGGGCCLFRLLCALADRGKVAGREPWNEPEDIAFPLKIL